MDPTRTWSRPLGDPLNTDVVEADAGILMLDAEAISKAMAERSMPEASAAGRSSEFT